MIAAVDNGPPCSPLAQLCRQAVSERGIAEAELLIVIRGGFVVFKLQCRICRIQTRNHFAQVDDVLDVVDLRHRVAEVRLFQALEIRCEIRKVLSRDLPVEGHVERQRQVGTR